MFTFLPLERIAEIMAEQNKDPSKRVAQHALAREFLEIVHGPEEAKAAEMQHRQLFRPRSSTAEPTPPPATPPKVPPEYAHKPEAQFINPGSGNKYAPITTYANMPSIRVKLPRSLVLEQPFNKVLRAAGLVASNSEGHRLIVNRGASIGSRPGDSGPMSDALEFTPLNIWSPEKNRDYVIDDKLVIFKVGKWKFKLVELVDDEEFDRQGLTAPGWEEFKRAKAEKEQKEAQSGTAKDAGKDNSNANEEQKEA